MKRGDIIAAVDAELERAMRLHKEPIHSYHEAEGVIREEFEEFWDEAKLKKPDPEKAYEELVQTAAMCCRAILDLGLGSLSAEGPGETS